MKKPGIDELLYETGLVPELFGQDDGLSVVECERTENGPMLALYQKRMVRHGRSLDAHYKIIGRGTRQKIERVLKQSVKIHFIHRLEFIARKINVRIKRLS